MEEQRQAAQRAWHASIHDACPFSAFVSQRPWSTLREPFSLPCWLFLLMSLQGIAVLGPPDTGLGPVSHHPGHGMRSFPRQRRVLLTIRSFPDPSGHPPALRRAPPPVCTQKAHPRCGSGTVRVFVLVVGYPCEVSRRALARSQILRATSAYSPIPPVFYQSISKHLSDAFEAGVYLKDGPTKEGEAPSSPPNPITDPAAMDGMMAGMKTQMVMMVPQMVIMGWINFFFQGFVLSMYAENLVMEIWLIFLSVKLPFPLTLGFKSMLQRGIETPDMDVRWVSSLSWYFLNFFGLNGLYRILLGSDNGESDELVSFRWPLIGDNSCPRCFSNYDGFSIRHSRCWPTRPTGL